MAENYLHNHKEFQNLIKIVGEKEGILDTLIEKDTSGIIKENQVLKKY